MPVVAWMIFQVYPPRAANDPDDPRALGCGGFFLIRRAALDAVGGYEPIRGDLADDVATAERLKAHGFRLHCALAPELLYTPMYGSLSELWAGFGKNAMRGLAHSYLNGFRSAALLVLGGVVPVATAAVVGGLLLCGMAGEWRMVCWGSLAAWLTMAGAFTPVFGQYGGARWRALAAPFAFGFMAALLCCAMWRAYRGSPIHWRGREVAPHGPGTETPSL
ncbi:MAG: hypothetical protein HYU66_13175 [Armatimonadetes bacterium]|nr:hypothetical protein [Armatimonadota bacterium]